MEKSPSKDYQPSFPGMEPDLQQKLDFTGSDVATKAKAKKTETGSGPANLGKAVRVTVPDFSDPKRPKTCLEVDFPIVPINALAKVETASGPARKRVYCMSKWWARRASTVFRSLLIAAATQAPTKQNLDGSSATDANGVPMPDLSEAARAAWDLYYANHQCSGSFSNLKVLDCFMGGGTTLVEASRLGFHVSGVDLNPVAWFVVKNELSCSDPDVVSEFFDRIEVDVKPIIQPFYVADCPRGHKGRWFRVGRTAGVSPLVSGASAPPPHQEADDAGPMPDDFDPLTLAPEDRKQYRYEGPEVVYTFWAKHGPCSRPGCGHRTPIFRSPVIAEKKLGVKYIPLTCKQCKTEFHAELGAARMAPAAQRVVLDSEFPFTEMSQPFAQRLLDYSKGKAVEQDQRIKELCDSVATEPGLCCPKCGEFSGQFIREILNKHHNAERRSEIDKKELNIQPPRNGTKHVFCYLLIDPDWMNGASGVVGGEPLGGYADATVEATSQWYERRLENMRLIEVRGRIKLTEDTSHLGIAEAGSESAEPVAQVAVETEGDDEEDSEEAAATGEAEEADRKEYGLPRFVTINDGRRIDTRKGTVPENSHFNCGRCGTKQDVRESIEQFGHNAPVSAHAIQCHCPECEAEGRVYGGRYFMSLGGNDSRRLVTAEREWDARRDTDLANFWPREEMPHSYMTHHANFALPKQGYTHWWKMFNSRQLLVHGQLLKSIFRLRQGGTDAWLHALGAWQEYSRHQCMFAFWDIQQDCLAPLFANPNYTPKNGAVENNLFLKIGRENWRSCREGVVEGLQWCRKPTELVLNNDSSGRKTDKVATGDPVLPNSDIRCGSSSELPFYADHTFDLVITDPPFGDNIFYSDLSNFFYAWLRLLLRHEYPDLFEPAKTPNAQEALAPRLLAEIEANDYYKVRLSGCWAEACRVMKDGGILAFTFHHSEDSQWAIVLESLFESGFTLEQTFPISSDDMKGEKGQYGAKGTEYDIIHVCRKRLADPTPVSWARMRQWVKAEMLRLKDLLVVYRESELSDADVRLILRGKALEFYSQHYGQVFTSNDEHLPLREALAGINQLLDEGTSNAADLPPSIVQPTAYQYLRLFTVKPIRTVDEVDKSLFSTAIQLRDLKNRGWVDERNRKATAIPIAARFDQLRQRPRKEMKTEIDQAHFLIGGAFPKSGVDLEQELLKDTWMVRKSVDAVLEWYARMAPEPDIREAATLAHTILQRTHEKLQQQPVELERQLQLNYDWDSE